MKDEIKQKLIDSLRSFDSLNTIEECAEAVDLFRKAFGAPNFDVGTSLKEFRAFFKMLPNTENIADDLVEILRHHLEVAIEADLELAALYVDETVCDKSSQTSKIRIVLGALPLTMVSIQIEVEDFGSSAKRTVQTGTSNEVYSELLNERLGSYLARQEKP